MPELCPGPEQGGAAEDALPLSGRWRQVAGRDQAQLSDFAWRTVVGRHVLGENIGVGQGIEKGSFSRVRCPGWRGFSHEIEQQEKWGEFRGCRVRSHFPAVEREHRQNLGRGWDGADRCW